MNSKRIVSWLLVLVMVLTATLTACTTPEETTEPECSTKIEASESTEASEITEISDVTTAPETAETTCAVSLETVESDTESDSATTEETTSAAEEAETVGTTTEDVTEVITEIVTEEETTTVPDSMIGETFDAEYAASFSVAKIFSDDMVVQRNEHIRVWGFAPESENGKKVSGEFKGMFAEAIVENGEWCITFGARLEADTNAAQMKIYTDKTEVIFSGVLVGDVYMIIGQSTLKQAQARLPTLIRTLL